jgi:hypothetical protein
LEKVDDRLISIRRDKEDHFILIKRTIHQEEISILNICAPNIEATIDFIKQNKTKKF